MTSHEDITIVSLAVALLPSSGRETGCGGPSARTAGEGVHVNGVDDDSWGNSHESGEVRSKTVKICCIRESHLPKNIDFGFHMSFQGCTGWWSQIFVIFTPTWGNDPI